MHELREPEEPGVDEQGGVPDETASAHCQSVSPNREQQPALSGGTAYWRGLQITLPCCTV